MFANSILIFYGDKDQQMCSSQLLNVE